MSRLWSLAILKENFTTSDKSCGEEIWLTQETVWRPCGDKLLQDEEVQTLLEDPVVNKLGSLKSLKKLCEGHGVTNCLKTRQGQHSLKTLFWRNLTHWSHSRNCVKTMQWQTTSRWPIQTLVEEPVVKKLGSLKQWQTASRRGRANTGLRPCDEETL
jgi:hypothetical protein